MTTPALTPVTAVQAFTLAAGVIDEPQVVNIYTLSTGVAERIESVYFTVVYPDNPSTNNVLVVQYQDPSGLIVWEGASPPLKAPSAADLEVHCGWSRLGNDTAQAALAMVHQDNDDVTRGWFNIRLPDLVLIATSKVNLLNYVDDGGEANPVEVSDATVTVSRDVGPGSSTTAIDLTPYLLPAAVG